jgi:hypothetical protein
LWGFESLRPHHRRSSLPTFDDMRAHATLCELEGALRAPSAFIPVKYRGYPRVIF